MSDNVSDSKGVHTSFNPPEEIRENPEQWAACIGGAVPEKEYLNAIKVAGFAYIQVLTRAGKKTGSVYSVTVKAEKA